MNKKIICCIVFCLFVCFSYAQEMRFEIVENSKTIFYQGDNKIIKTEIEEFAKREYTNFKAQADFKLPIKKPKENTISKMEAILTNVKSFDEITYTPKNSTTPTALFKDIYIIEDYYDDFMQRVIIANVRIPPFKAVKMKFTISMQNNFIIFRSVNIESFKYWIFTIIEKENLSIFFAGEVKGNTLECYALGVGDTGSFFLIQKKLKEELFVRVEAIVNWIYKLLITTIAQDTSILQKNVN